MPRLPLPTGDARRPDIRPPQGGAGMQTLAVLVVVIGVLYFGRDIFVPIALAVLLSFALSPLVSWLRRRRLPKMVSVVSVVLLAFLALFAFGFVVATQVSQLGSNLPRYETNIREKIRSLRAGTAEGGVVERTSEMLRDLGEEMEAEPKTAAGAATASADREADDASALEPGEEEPIPVQIQPPDPEPLEVFESMIGPLIEPLATAGLVIVFVIFMLLQREDLRDRFIRLAGSTDLHRTTEALSDGGKRVGKYLLMQLTVNATYGIPVALGLWLIGVPNPLLWGMLAMVLRFVPYIGPVIGAMFPLALAIAVDPGWTMLLWTAALFIVLELVSNNIVEPWLYGASTGLSPVAIIVSAIFWTWLWGPIGLLLSTPLTVCLVVLGRHVPQFGFLDVLLGSEPVLSPQESLYQRLLAGDPDEATERAEEFLEEHSLLAFYEKVAIPALALAEADRARGVLDDGHRAILAQGALTLVDNLSEQEDAIGADDEESEGETSAAQAPHAPAVLGPDWGDRPVLVAGGRGNLDDAAAAMLTQLLQRRGIGVRLLTSETMAHYTGIELTGVQAICLSYMNQASLAHARYLVQRLRRRTSVPIIVGFWSMDPEEAERRDLVKGTRADMSAISLGSALDQIVELAEAAAGAAEPSAAVRAAAPERPADTAFGSSGLPQPT